MGTAAALMAATVRAAVYAAGAADPSVVFGEVARQAAHDLDVTGVFATAFRARLNLHSGDLSCTDAGHGLTVIVARTAVTVS